MGMKNLVTGALISAVTSFGSCHSESKERVVEFGDERTKALDSFGFQDPEKGDSVLVANVHHYVDVNKNGSFDQGIDKSRKVKPIILRKNGSSKHSFGASDSVGKVVIIGNDVLEIISKKQGKVVE